MSKIKHTIVYNVEVTEVVSGVETEFLANDYKEILKDKIRNVMNADDVHITGYKVFRHDGDDVEE